MWSVRTQRQRLISTQGFYLIRLTSTHLNAIADPPSPALGACPFIGQSGIICYTPDQTPILLWGTLLS